MSILTKRQELFAAADLFNDQFNADQHVYGSDSFNRADDNADIGALDGGVLSGVAWEVLAGTWGILNNQGRYITDSGGNKDAVVAESHFSDGAIQTKGVSVPGTIRLCFRFTDVDNGLIVYIARTVSQVIIYRLEGGTYTPLKSDGTIVVAANDLWRVRFYGPLIQVFQNGALILETTSTFNQTATKHGFGGGTAGLSVDNFTFESVGPNPGLWNLTDTNGIVSQGSILDIGYLADSIAGAPAVGTAYPAILTPLLGGANGWHLNSQGGTGFLNEGPTPPTTEIFADRVDDIIAANPDWVFVQGGVNDIAEGISGFEAAVSGVLSAIRTGLPFARIFAIGPLTYEFPPSADCVTFGAAISSAVTALADPLITYIDPLTDPWITADKVSLYNSGDGIHPNAAGATYYAGKVRDAVSQYIPASQLVVGGLASPAYGDPELIAVRGIVRRAGVAMEVPLTTLDDLGSFAVGFSSSSSAFDGSGELYAKVGVSNVLYNGPVGSGTLGDAIGTLPVGSETLLRFTMGSYDIANRAISPNGGLVYYSTDAGVTWKLVWRETTAANSPLYPALDFANAEGMVAKFNSVKVLHRGFPMPKIYDSFNRANGAIGTADSGQAWTVARMDAGASASFVIASNKASQNGGVNDQLAYIDAGVPDGIAQVSLAYASGLNNRNYALLLRLVDTTKFLLAYIANASIILYRRQPSSFTNLASAAVTWGNSAKLTASMNGSVIKLFVDDVLVLTHTLSGGDFTTFGGATKHGLYGPSSATATFEDYIFQGGL